MRSAASALSALLLAVGMLAVAAPAHADLGDNGQITLDKNVDGAAAITTQAGGSFTYNLIVGCDDNPCIDAVLTDPLPAEFAGFTLNNLQTNPPSAAIDASFTGCTVGAAITPPCTLDVDFETPLGTLGGAPQHGIPAGTTYRVSLTLTVPNDLTPAWPHRNTPITNTATADAATTVVHDVQDTATVTVDERYYRQQGQPDVLAGLPAWTRTVPLTVLVNGASASAAELVTGALQDQHRATVIGTRTFGKGSIQSVIALDQDSGIKFTVARYFTPDGHEIQARGVTPDIVVTPAAAADDDLLLREADLAKHLPATQPLDPAANAKREPPESTRTFGTRDDKALQAAVAVLTPPADKRAPLLSGLLRKWSGAIAATGAP